jgi:hypothetical protein
MHFSILYMEKRRIPELAGPKYLPEEDILGPVLPGQAGGAPPVAPHRPPSDALPGAKPVARS